MKRYLSLLTLFYGSIYVSAQNPFEKLGYTPNIATYSQGQFNEFHDQDTIVQIGSVLFNTNSRQIVAFVQTDTLHSEATLQPDVVSRWMSPDPLAAKYASLSPYNFVANSPLIFIDPDGRIIEYANDETERVVKEAMAADPEFAKAMLTLDNSDVVYTYSYKGATNYSPAPGSGNNGTMGNVTSDGTKIYIAFETNEGSATDGKFTTLYHETDHGLQFEHGEFGFEQNQDGNWISDGTFDINDEVKAHDAGFNAPGVDPVVKERFMKKTPEQKRAILSRQSQPYDKLKQRADSDIKAGNPIDRNEPKNPSGDNQLTVRTKNRFFKTYKEREK